MHIRFAAIVLTLSFAAYSSQRDACEPGPALRADIEKASAAAIADPFAFDQNVAPFLALRERYPNDLFAHEWYQDAVHRHGIEGHLRALSKEYDELEQKHPGELLYRYLSVRTKMGRSTLATIQSLGEIVAEYPDFAPAHRTLAEIYSSEMFHDAEKAKLERDRFAALCPGAAIARRPDPPPEPSQKIEEAARMFAAGGDPDQIIARAIQGLKEDEWRGQRIRPFDWFSAEFKRQNVRDLRAAYGRAWAIQIRCHRKAGRAEQAADLLALMDQRTGPLRRQPGWAYWDALSDLISLYLEANQADKASEKLEQMKEFLDEHPDQEHALALAELAKRVKAPGPGTR